MNLELRQGVQGLACGTQCQMQCQRWHTLCPDSCCAQSSCPCLVCNAWHPLPMCNAQDAAPGAAGCIVPGCCTCRAMPVLAASCLVHGSIMHTQHMEPGTWYMALGTR